MAENIDSPRRFQGLQDRFFTEATFTLLAIGVICQSTIALHAPTEQLGLATTALLLVVGVTMMSMLMIDKARTRQLIVLAVSLVLWLSILIFYIPLSSPYYSVNFLIVLLAARLIDARMTMLVGALLVIGVEISVFNKIDNYGQIRLLLEPSLHVALLILVSLVTATIIVQAEEQDNPAHARLVLLERERLQALINSMADGVITTDQSGFVVLYNGAALELLDINVSLESQSLKNYVKLLDKQQKPVDIFELSRNARTYYVSRDLSLQLSDGEILKIYLSISPVRLGYDSGGAHGYVILMRDITKEKSLEEERDEFISVVSHELRTPIAIAEGNISNAQMLANKGTDAPTIKQSLEQAHDQVVFLADMINDLSTLSRAERGRLQVTPEVIDIPALVKTVTDGYREDADDRALKIVTTVDPAAKSIVSSRLYVQEILQNFITNALKYTQQGSVTVAAQPIPGGIRLAVTDTGIGISKTDQKKLFDKFFRSEDYRTRETSGTGLGLYVTKKLANLINANINVVSELNQGTTFTIDIPSMNTQAPAKAPLTPKAS